MKRYYHGEKKEETFEIGLSQGNYGKQQNKESWICPECETINNSAVCVLCGYAKPAEKKKRNPVNGIHKKAFVAVGVALIAILGMIISSFLIPFNRYKKANEFLEEKQYEQACILFAELDSYRDSRSLLKETVFEWSINGTMEEVPEKIEYISDPAAKEDLQERICDSFVAVAEKAFLNNQYKKAYELYTQISEYRNVDKIMSNIRLEWAKSLLEAPDLVDAKAFLKTVTLTHQESKGIYEIITTRDHYIYDPKVTYNLVEHDYDVRILLLDSLTGDFPLKEKLKDAFTTLEKNFEIYNSDQETILNDRELLTDLWEVPVIQNILIHDSNLAYTLSGKWAAKNGLYIEFLPKDDYTECSFTFSPVAQPEGTAFYAIRKMEFIWADENNNELAKVFRFTLTEPEKLELYNYKDGKSYLLTKK